MDTEWQLRERWETLVKDMILPELRKTAVIGNYRWFLRNGGIMNHDKPYFLEAVEITKQLINLEDK